ncbi:MAG: beta-propeller fold lactonase family protein [Caldilineaceae bacterium]
MLRKVSLFLVLVLTMVMTAPVLAQERAPSAANLYLPLVTANAESQSVAVTGVNDEDLTDTLDSSRSASSSEAGAVFVTTNATDPIRGNEIVMYRRAADGALTLTGRFPTGGMGLGSGLGSQGALVLSNNGRWLFTVNGGSNEISVFAVHSAGLVLTDKVASGGSRPVSLTVRKNLLYVLNAGDSGNITGFELDKEGKLTALANATRNLSNNGSGAAPGPGQISFSPKGDLLIVTEKGTNLIDTYAVDKQGHSTGPTIHISSGVTPFGFAFAQAETLVVSEAFGGAASASAVSSYHVDRRLTLISASVPTGQTAACWIAVTKDGKYAYSTNAGSASLSGYQVNTDGSLTLLNSRAGETGDGTGPTDAAVSNNGRLIYALSPRSQTVIGFTVQADGSLTLVGSFGGLEAGAAGIAAW